MTEGVAWVVVSTEKGVDVGFDGWDCVVIYAQSGTHEEGKNIFEYYVQVLGTDIMITSRP